MKKPKKICDICRKIKTDDCERCKVKAFENIDRSNQGFYNSQKWRKYSHSLRKSNPLCIICLEEGRTTPSALVDHIKPISKGGDAYALDNLRCLCHKCHNSKSSLDRHNIKK